MTVDELRRLLEPMPGNSEIVAVGNKPISISISTFDTCPPSYTIFIEIQGKKQDSLGK